ncbi:hypothetical protein [Deinococcus wulumuqiensis]|uniref:hypothetical protein n=1 Tax=Deinococcus wulumuqiensis TaxID=980427 RepID=UPI00242BD639|nr:hypothetical protein [Deinococcus wulumuqiensis]
MTLWTPAPYPAAPPHAVGPDPDLLLALLPGLSAEQARHVAVLTERGITANSAALADALAFHRFAPHPVTGELRAVQGTGGGLGSLIAKIFGTAPKTTQHDGAGQKVPAGVKVECRDEQTGPYRRVYSKPGYAFQRSSVYLPTDKSADLYEEKSGGSGDTAFVYVGGWGGKGGAVDAGFQHGRYMAREQDDWAPFFLVEQPGGPSAITVATERQRSGDPWRLLAGQTADLTFWVSEEAGQTILSMTMSGVTNLDREAANLTLRAPVDPRYRWDALGGGNVLKRMTTIGQRRGHQNLQSGSYLRNVRWSGSVIGTSEADARAWTGLQTGGYCSFPDPKTPEGLRADGAGAKWRVQYRDAGNETDSVTLR